MILNIGQITSALSKITALATGEKTVPGVLLDINENFVNVCYSNGRKSVIERIDAVPEDGDKQEQIVLNYQRFVEIIGCCQPTGKIVTDDIQFILTGDDIINIRAEKKIGEQGSEDEEEKEY